MPAARAQRIPTTRICTPALWPALRPRIPAARVMAKTTQKRCQRQPKAQSKKPTKRRNPEAPTERPRASAITSGLRSNMRGFLAGTESVRPTPQSSPSTISGDSVQCQLDRLRKRFVRRHYRPTIGHDPHDRANPLRDCVRTRNNGPRLIFLVDNRFEDQPDFGFQRWNLLGDRFKVQIDFVFAHLDREVEHRVDEIR